MRVGGCSPIGEMQRLLVGRLRLVRPAARDVERVPRLQGELVDGRADLAELRRPALVLQRQFEQRLVQPPALAARDLEDEHVVRVVMDREALGGGRREVGIRLNRESRAGISSSRQ